MAEFYFNDGATETVNVENLHKNTRLFLTARIDVGSDKFKVAGHSIIYCNDILNDKNAQFEDYSLGFAFELDGKELKLLVDVSKFKVKEGAVVPADEMTECIITIEAGNTLIKQVSLSDQSNIEDNSVFNFSFTFKIN